MFPIVGFFCLVCVFFPFVVTTWWVIWSIGMDQGNWRMAGGGNGMIMESLKGTGAEPQYVLGWGLGPGNAPVWQGATTWQTPMLPPEN